VQEDEATVPILYIDESAASVSCRGCTSSDGPGTRTPSTDRSIRWRAPPRGTGNTMYPLLEVRARYATVGEMCDALRMCGGNTRKCH